MAWIPRYILSGGMYGGRNCPAGSLTDLVALCGNSYTVSDCVFASGEDTTWSDTYTAWAGAYGMSDDMLRNYIMTHMDGNPHEFALAEIEVENPPTAQFYKQSIVFYLTVIAQEVIEPTTDPQLYDDLHMCNFNLSLSKIVRREYPTPYSAYTETTFSPTFGIMAGNFFISGSRVLGGPYYYLTDKMRIAIGDIKYQNTDYFGIGIYSNITRCDSVYYGWGAGVIGVSYDTLNNAFGKFEPDETEDPNEEPGEGEDGEGEGGESGEGGGEGEHDRRQDPIPYPEDPPISGASAGFITMYEMTEANMQSFANELFDFDWWQAVKNFFADPMDFICGVMIVPFAPKTSGHACPVFHQASPLPDIKMSHYWPVIQDQYQDIDCGSLTIPKYYDSAFDYNPYTSVRIFLPYIGYKDLDPDEVMGNTIQVKYKVDCMTGDCVAFIMRTAVSMPSMTPQTQVIAQFSGNMGVRVAFGRQSFDSAIQASVQLMTGLAGGIIRGASGIASAMIGQGGTPGANTETQVMASVAEGAGNVAAAMPNVEQMKSQVMKSGIMGANAGFMSVQKPFIIRTIPRQSRPDNYKLMHGYPSNITGPIGARGFRGYMEVDTIQLDGITAMEQEKAEMAALLKGGVLYGNA